MARSLGAYETKGSVVVRGETFEYTFDKKNGLLEPYIYSISEDSKGNVWIGTRGGGLYRFSNGRFIKIRIKDFNVYDVTAIQEDSFGELWIGTNRGLVRYDGENVELIDKKRGLSSHVIYKIVEKPHPPPHLFSRRSPGFTPDINFSSDHITP